MAARLELERLGGAPALSSSDAQQLIRVGRSLLYALLSGKVWRPKNARINRQKSGLPGSISRVPCATGCQSGQTAVFAVNVALAEHQGPRERGLEARRDSSAATGEQGTSKADPKAVSAHGVAAAMAADTSRPLDMLIIANRLSEGASAL